MWHSWGSDVLCLGIHHVYAGLEFLVTIAGWQLGRG